MSNYQKTVVAGVVFIALLMAVLMYSLRFEYLEGKLTRVNRFSGEVQLLCNNLKNPVYLTVPQCELALEAEKIPTPQVTPEECKTLHEDAGKDLPIDLFYLIECLKKGL